MKNLILVYPKKGSIGASINGDISLAMLYLSGAARDICDSIEIFDFNAPVGIGKTNADFFKVVDNMLYETNSATPLIIGINVMFSALFPSVRELCNEIKEHNKNIIIVIGGMHPTLFSKEIIDNCKEIDAVAIGESDKSFIQLLHYFYNNCDVKNINSVCLRINGKSVVIPPQKYINNLDLLPRPGYEFIDFREYETNTENWWSPDCHKIKGIPMSVLSSRSCPNECNFCAIKLVMGDKIRYRTAEKFFEEIKFLYSTYGINYFKIEDDNFTLIRKRAVKFCELIIESRIKVYFNLRNGLFIRSLDQELIQLMRRAGFIMTALAVESGSKYIREKIIGKRISNNQIINAFRWCKDAGIMSTMFLIIGFPEETIESLEATLTIIDDVPCDKVALNILKPLPGTALFDQCLNDNLLLGEYKIDNMWKGDFENTRTNISFVQQYKSEIQDIDFAIMPYNVSLEVMQEYYHLIQEKIKIKNKRWVERVKNNHRDIFD